MIRNISFLTAVALMLSHAQLCAGPSATALREASEFIIGKFGKGAAGQTIEGVADATAKAVAKHGDEALPLLRNSGHAGFTALKEAGDKAPDVIKLFARRGEDAIWVISEPRKLAIFIKHGDSAADALLKHPGIADDLIGHYGDRAIGALNGISRQSAQRLSMLSQDGLLEVANQSPELLSVIQKYGDKAMDFIWRNKGSLAVTAVLATFLADPQSYISGTKELIVDSVAKNTHWTLIIAGLLGVTLLPFIGRSITKYSTAWKTQEEER